MSSSDEAAPATEPAPPEAELEPLEGEPVVEVQESPAPVDADIDALDVLDVLAATEKERDDYLDALRHLQADFENFKKRIQRQQSETLARAGEGLVTKLLPVLDTIDLAKQHGAGDGVEQIATALLDVLAKEGLERMDPVGQPFDPNEHEAVVHEPAGEGDEEPVVVGLMRAGYRWKGRLVRAAMVTVRG
ncbi:MAG TPA: nucleotide exchange factor GrpE [Acidimicrobiales bacterium]|nr:nucleotide exchange factor GrpE [Acidimicrobiales bacterium]